MRGEVIGKLPISQVIMNGRIKERRDINSSAANFAPKEVACTSSDSSLTSSDEVIFLLMMSFHINMHKVSGEFFCSEGKITMVIYKMLVEIFFSKMITSSVQVQRKSDAKVNKKNYKGMETIK